MLCHQHITKFRQSAQSGKCHSWVAQSRAIWGVACMVSKPVKRVRTEEPDEGNIHVRICGEGAGQPVPLPGKATAKSRRVL